MLSVVSVQAYFVIFILSFRVRLRNLEYFSKAFIPVKLLKKLKRTPNYRCVKILFIFIFIEYSNKEIIHSVFISSSVIL